MANSVGENIVAAMVTALNAPSNKPATTYRTRIESLAQRELPAFVLYALKETPETKGPGTKLRKRTVRLEMLVEGAAPADSAIDPLYVYAVNTLLADATLTGYIRRLEEAAIQWETEASYQDASMAALDFEVVFVTSNDPTIQI